MSFHSGNVHEQEYIVTFSTLWIVLAERLETIALYTYEYDSVDAIADNRSHTRVLGISEIILF